MKRLITCFLFLGPFSVFAQTTLQGTITRSDNDHPIPGAQILIRGTSYVGTSNPDGTYRIIGLPGGVYGVACSAHQLLGQITGPLSLFENQTLHFRLDSPEAERFPIRGRITCQDQPCSGVWVLAKQRDNLRSSAVSNLSGNFSIEGLFPGTYQVEAYLIGYLSTRISEVLLGEAPSSVALNLSPAPRNYRLTGRVGLWDNPADKSGSTVRLNGQDPAQWTMTDTGGLYRLESVPAGLLSLTATHAGYQSQTHLDVLIESDANLDFVLGNPLIEPVPVFRISGRVELALPEAAPAFSPSGTRVTVWSEEEQTRYTTFTDDFGRYSIHGIPEGEYKAGAAREGFFSETTDGLILTADQVVHFTLEWDSDYDFGPAEQGDLSSCGCHQQANPFFWPLLLLLLCGRIKST